MPRLATREAARQEARQHGGGTEEAWQKPYIDTLATSPTDSGRFELIDSPMPLGQLLWFAQKSL